MRESTSRFFISLFREAFQKCFGAELRSGPSETDCKHFSNRIFEATGLVIGAKSLKNYALYVLKPADVKPENPSIATLDTLARYTLNAPYTSEAERKAKDSHYPYWFQYRNKMAGQDLYVPQPTEPEIEPYTERGHKPNKTILAAATALAILALAVVIFFWGNKEGNFTDNFDTVSTDSLKNRGWWLQAPDQFWWQKRNELPSHLTLFTLQGDNWADSAHAPLIRNLMLRNLSLDCFTTEVHFDGFIPTNRWQQAGILLLEDSSFTGKGLRLSLAYNDFFGGYDKPREIILQGITFDGNQAANPEEILHLPLFSLLPEQELLVRDNLQKSALRIEKTGRHFRFLYATGQTNNFAFREALRQDLKFEPHYIGLFASGGFVEQVSNMPVHINYFNVTGVPCK